MQEFSLHGGTFNYSIHVILCSDLEKASTYVNEKLGQSFATSETFNCLGKIFYSETDDYCPVMWLPSYPTTTEEVATVAHELLHLVFRITNWAGIIYSPSSEEVYTHLLSYLVRQFYEKAHPPTLLPEKKKRK